MKRLRVPLPGLSAGRRELPDEQARYVGRVHRLAEGSALSLFDGESGTEAEATIVSVDGGRVMVEIEDPRPATIAAGRRITLLQCLGKGDKMDAVVRDATELGATTIVPVESERSIVKLGDRAAARVARWRKIAEEASRQCGRGDVPRVTELASFDHASEHVSEVKLLLVPGGTTLASRALRELGPRSVALLVGPEGGISPDEIERALSRGWVPTSLGPRVLRTETVAAAVLGGLLLLDEGET